MGTENVPAAVMTLEDLEFSFQTSLKREQIDSLHELGFLGRKENTSWCDRNSAMIGSAFVLVGASHEGGA